MSFIGKQFIVTFEKCVDQFVSDPARVTSNVYEAAVTSGLIVLNSLEHHFEPQGLTYVLLLSQSHLIVHTWPEYKTLILDLYVCSANFDFETFIDKILKMSQAEIVKKNYVF
jgi:S-adenosylmethionine decarboxylase proenzyme